MLILLVSADSNVVLAYLTSNLMSVSFTQTVMAVPRDRLLDMSGLILQLPIAHGSCDLHSKVMVPAIAGALDLMPNASALYRNQGRIALWEGDYLKAVDALSKAHNLNARDAIATWLLGNAYWLSGQQDAARAVWRSVGMLEKSTWRYIESAQHAFDVGQFDVSVELARRVTEIDPSYAYAYFLLGRNYEQLRHADDAIASYHQAGQLAAPDEWFKGSSYAYIGSLYRTVLNQPESALSAYQEAVWINPNDMWSWIAIGHLYMDLGQLDRADAAYRTAAYPLPGIPAAHWGLGRVALSRGLTAEAIPELKLAVEGDPSTVQYRADLADAYFAERQYEEALVEYAAALRLDPLNPHAQERMRVLKAKP